jgi:hypothetical protein
MAHAGKITAASFIFLGDSRGPTKKENSEAKEAKVSNFRATSLNGHRNPERLGAIL